MKLKSITVKLLAAFAAVIVLCAAAFAFFNSKSEKTVDIRIPAGFVDKTGSSVAGKDLDEYFYYTYEAVPRLSNEYEVVTADNIDRLYEDIYSYEKQGGQGHFSDKVSKGDYFIAVYYDTDGNVIDYSRNNNVKIYFYDTETYTLHYVYYCF